MVNLEHKLTVDDLIVEYLAHKVKNGYGTYIVGEEFMDFLSFFREKFAVEDTLDDKDILFERFFERKNKYDCHNKQHMDMEYKYEIYDYVLFANYGFSDFDLSIITTYFMNDKLVSQMRNVIGEYFKDKPKRVIDTNKKINEDELLTGKCVAVQIIREIWDSYIREQIKYDKWPKQCTDFNKYFIQTDLAQIINIPSIKKDLINIYNVFSKRVGVLYHEDKDLRICSYNGSFFAKVNYDLIIKDYEKMMKIAFDRYKKSLTIDLKSFEFSETHDEGLYDHYYKTTTNKIINENVKKLVKTIDRGLND